MLEVKPISLRKGDEFSADQGKTWHVVKLVREAALGTKVVVILESGREMILNADKDIVVKL
jgi:hypothetical protein